MNGLGRFSYCVVMLLVPLLLVPGCFSSSRRLGDGAHAQAARGERSTKSGYRSSRQRRHRRIYKRNGRRYRGRSRRTRRYRGRSRRTRRYRGRSRRTRRYRGRSRRTRRYRGRSRRTRRYRGRRTKGSSRRNRFRNACGAPVHIIKKFNTLMSKTEFRPTADITLSVLNANVKEKGYFYFAKQQVKQAIASRGDKSQGKRHAIKCLQNTNPTDNCVKAGVEAGKRHDEWLRLTIAKGRVNFRSRNARCIRAFKEGKEAIRQIRRRAKIQLKYYELKLALISYLGCKAGKEYMCMHFRHKAFKNDVFLYKKIPKKDLFPVLTELCTKKPTWRSKLRKPKEQLSSTCTILSKYADKEKIPDEHFRFAIKYAGKGKKRNVALKEKCYISMTFRKMQSILYYCGKLCARKRHLQACWFTCGAMRTLKIRSRTSKAVCLLARRLRSNARCRASVWCSFVKHSNLGETVRGLMVATRNLNITYRRIGAVPPFGGRSRRKHRFMCKAKHLRTKIIVKIGVIEGDSYRAVERKAKKRFGRNRTGFYIYCGDLGLAR